MTSRFCNIRIWRKVLPHGFAYREGHFAQSREEMDLPSKFCLLYRPSSGVPRCDLYVKQLHAGCSLSTLSVNGLRRRQLKQLAVTETSNPTQMLILQIQASQLLPRPRSTSFHNTESLGKPPALSSQLCISYLSTFSILCHSHTAVAQTRIAAFDSISRAS